MVQGITSGGHIGVIAVTALRYARMGGQALILPVRPAQMITASFKHIQLRPDSRLENGIPLYKLKILDSLIDRFSRKDAAAAADGLKQTAASARMDLTPAANADSVDAMIAAMSEALRASGTSYRAGFLPEPGAFIDLLA